MSLTGCQRYKRANDFENYVVERAESLARAEFTEEVRSDYIKSIKEQPESADYWFKDMKDRKVRYRKNLHKRCRYIYTFDSIQGREVSFSEFYDSIMALEDTSAIITDDIKLQRVICSYNSVEKRLYHFEETKRYLKGKTR
ncbi:MAG: hypothetical protein K2K82_07145 [Muribaculaceae bacterium]|nr:hypothetical protein [Muribaculaceae bacterium]